MTDLKYKWGVVGHDNRLRELEKDIAEHNLAQAYLFAGPDNVGKFSVAKKLAHILQCENNYCHICHVCREIARGYHGDTIEIADDGDSIKIETVREVLHRLHMSKQAPYKILLVQNIERMTAESGNAMLKTLEDPPENVIFLLTASNTREVLPTILSRVRTYHFKRVAEQKMLELLQTLYPLVEPDQLKTMCSFALGKPGMAITFMESQVVYDAYKKMYNDVVTFVKTPDCVSQFVYIGELVKASREEQSNQMVQDFLEILLAVLRKKMVELAQACQGMRQSGSAGEAGLKAEAGLKKIIGLIREAQKAHDLLKRNVNKKLLLENLMLQL